MPMLSVKSANAMSLAFSNLRIQLAELILWDLAGSEILVMACAGFTNGTKRTAHSPHVVLHAVVNRLFGTGRYSDRLN